MIKFLKRLFKTKYKSEVNTVEPNIRDAWLTAYDLYEDFDGLMFYLSRIADLEMPPALKEYAKKTEFNLLSLRDEIKILSDKDSLRKSLQRINEERAKNGK